MELRGKTALVTGGAKRVGRAIALRLAQAGCDVAIHYRSSADEAAATVAECSRLGVAAGAFAADLADPAAPSRLVEEVLARFGRLDILINNASAFERMTLDDFSLDRWNETLQTNLTAPLQLAHAARGPLKAARGRIINLCDAAVARHWPDHLAYIVSKGALDTLTRTLARAFAPEVNVCGVAPGVAEWPEDYDAATRERFTRRIPLGRAGSAADIAAAVHYLLAEGDYVTGVILPIDGGRGLI